MAVFRSSQFSCLLCRHCLLVLTDATFLCTEWVTQVPKSESCRVDFRWCRCFLSELVDTCWHPSCPRVMFCRQKCTLSCSSAALTVHNNTVIQTGDLIWAQDVAGRTGQPIFLAGATISVDEVAFFKLLTKQWCSLNDCFKWRRAFTC